MTTWPSRFTPRSCRRAYVACWLGLAARSSRDRSTGGRVIAFYGAKGGVGTTTLAINTAIALRKELNRTVALVDANLQFGDHRVFLDLGPDSALDR